MKKFILTPIFIVVIFQLALGQVNGPQAKNYWPKAGVTYEIFVQSFNDSNGDGIGDFNGVTEKLDYIRNWAPMRSGLCLLCLRRLTTNTM